MMLLVLALLIGGLESMRPVELGPSPAASEVLAPMAKKVSGKKAEDKSEASAMVGKRLPADSEDLRVALLQNLANEAAKWWGVWQATDGTPRGEHALAILRTLRAAVLSATTEDHEALLRLGDVASKYLRSSEGTPIDAPVRVQGGDPRDDYEAAAFDLRGRAREWLETDASPREMAEYFMASLVGEDSELRSRVIGEGVNINPVFGCDDGRTYDRHVNEVAKAFDRRFHRPGTSRETTDSLARALVIDGLIAIGYPEPKARRVFGASEKRVSRANKREREEKRISAKQKLKFRH